jgi:hypothetical protein
MCRAGGFEKEKKRSTHPTQPWGVLQTGNAAIALPSLRGELKQQQNKFKNYHLFVSIYN